MKMLYLIIPISLVLLGLAIGVFLWAVRSGQYEDLDGPSVRILLDDDDDAPTEAEDHPYAAPAPRRRPTGAPGPDD